MTDLYSFGTPVGVTELILCRTYTYNRLTFIRDSRRSYRTYLMLRSLTYSEVPVGTTEITERILVFWSTYLSYGTYTGLKELIFVYRTYSYLTDLILVLRNGITRRYYITCTYLLIQEYP